MSIKSERTSEIIDTITSIRAQTNYYWMDILAIAMKRAPEETRLVLKGIAKNDKEVTKCLSKL
jgi:hypothetical protein